MTEHFFNTLKIENFRGIKSLEINDLARVNLFVGENNCGKTTVLEAASLLARIADPGWMIWLANHVRQLQVADASDIKDFFYNREHGKGIGLSCVQAKGGRFLKISPFYGNLLAAQANGSTSAASDANTKRPIHFNNEDVVAGQYPIGFQYDFAVADPITGKRKGAHQASIRWTEPGNLQFTPYLDVNYKEAMKYIYCWKAGYDHGLVDQMLNEKQKGLLLSVLQSIDPKVQDIKTGSRNLVSVDIGLDSFIPINLLGDGVIRILNMLSVINWTTDGGLVIDEIEDGLHVTALEKAWGLILEHSHRSSAQIFLTTHSEDAIKSLRNVLDEKRFSDAVACYRLVKFEDDETEAYRYSQEQLGQALDSDTDIRV